MTESVQVLERRIDELRAAVRRSVIAGDRVRAGALRAELRGAERAWEYALAALEADPAQAAAEALPEQAPVETLAERVAPVQVPSEQAAAGARTGALLPIREQVHHALTLLAVPAAPKLIVEVHAAFFGAAAGDLAGTKFTHLRRDDERSYRAAPGARPYYLCSALTAGHLAPARGLLAVSTWPLQRRIVGPLSPRVDFLTAAVHVAERAARLPADDRAVRRLLGRFAANIPGAGGGFDPVRPEAVIAAARAELEVHVDADRAQRDAAAQRARRQLDDAQRLFGSRLRVLAGST